MITSSPLSTPPDSPRPPSTSLPPSTTEADVLAQSAATAKLEAVWRIIEEDERRRTEFEGSDEDGRLARVALL